MASYIDIAVNLAGSKLEHQLEQVITDAQAANVAAFIVVGSHLPESQRVIELCQQCPKHLFATAGVHPHHASTWNDSSAQQLNNMLEHNTVVALGECGLDYNRNFSTPAQQRYAFEAQLELATHTQKPIYLHCRDAHQDFIKLIKQYRPQLSKAVLHCFTGNRNEMQQCLDLDLHLGITGWVCDERRGQALAELVKDIPANRLMLETDSPYLLPRNMTPKPKSSVNYPKYLPIIAETIAKLRNEPLEIFSATCLNNTLAFFNLENRI
ncbi:MAG: TatD family hydrolase [Parashewanella sp.]